MAHATYVIVYVKESNPTVIRHAVISVDTDDNVFWFAQPRRELSAIVRRHAIAS